VTGQDVPFKTITKFGLQINPGRRQDDIAWLDSVKLNIEGQERVLGIDESSPRIDKSSFGKGSNANLTDARRVLVGGFYIDSHKVHKDSPESDAL
jgi:hypothetical protein